MMRRYTHPIPMASAHIIIIKFIQKMAIRANNYCLCSKYVCYNSMPLN